MTDQAASWPSPDSTGEYVALRADKGNMLIRRWVGAWIDFIALALLVFGPGMVVSLVMQAARGPGAVSDGFAGLLVLFDVVLALAYFPVTEGLWGRSLGKFVTGTIVVGRDGARATLGQALVRTLLRLVEVNPFLAGGIPAGISLLATKGKQRLGDLAAGTYVVPVKALQAAKTQTHEVF